MRVERLHRVTGFWDGLFFVRNHRKMRNALMEFLKGEGIKCKLEDRVVLFEYNDCCFNAGFKLWDNYAECEISYYCGDDDYEALDMQDKTFISDKVNTDKENHCIVLSYNDSLKLRTSFYFTSKRMLLDLFNLHFEELIDSLDLVLDIVLAKIEYHKDHKNRRIGFNMYSCSPPQEEPDKAQALKNKECVYRGTCLDY